jgi:ubiquitin-protein ligase E3 C
MFDGSYRTQQRVVNLGSSTNSNRKRNKPAQDRSTILEKARLLREQRYIEQKQAKACIVIQQRVRGNIERCYVGQQWHNEIVQMISSFVKNEKGSCSADECIKISENVTFLFNVWLRLHLQPSRRTNPSSNVPFQQQFGMRNPRDKQIYEMLYLYSTFIQKTKHVLHSSIDPSPVQECITPLASPALLIVRVTLEQIQKQDQRYQTTSPNANNGSVITSRLSDEALIEILLHVFHLQPADHVDIFASSDVSRFIVKNPEKRMYERILILLVETYDMVFDRISMSVTKVTLQANPDQSMLMNLYRCALTIFSALDDTLYYRALRGALSLIEPSSAICKKENRPPHRKTILQQCLPDILHVLRPNRRTFNESIPSYNEKYKDVTIPKNISFAIQHLIGKYGILTLQRFLVNDILPITENLHRAYISLNNETKSTNSNELYEMALWMQYMKYILMDAVFDSATLQRSKGLVGLTRLRLLWMIQCMVRGDIIHSPSNSSTPSGSIPSVDDSNDDDSVDDDDSGLRQFTATLLQNSQPRINSDALTPSSNAATPLITKPNRISKSDLQTVPKLDRLYADAVRKIDVVVASKLAPSSLAQVNDPFYATEDYLALLAKQFADASLLLKWGVILLSRVDDGDADFILSGNDMEFLTMLRFGQDDFLYLCFAFLQTTTGLRLQQNAATSPALNTLAFSSSFIKFLWKYILRQRTVTDFLLQHSSILDVFCAPQSFLTYSTANEGYCFSLALFSDLFAHHLIVMKDEQFLSNFTTCLLPTVGFKPSVSIEDIIQHFKTVLYELYWTKPVCKIDCRLILGTTKCDLFQKSSVSQLIATSDDDCLAAVRARLLLTGTKLWNSIYERWCRLHSYARFCDESVWWFPIVASNSSLTNNSLVLSRSVDTSEQPIDEQLRSLQDNNEDPMDIDSASSSDDDVDVTTDHNDGEGDRLAAIFLDPKMARVLASIPQALPFEQRVKIFDSLLRADKVKFQNDSLEFRHFMGAMMRDPDTAEIPGRETVHVRRNELYKDSMDQLNKLGPKLKRRVQVTFTNQHGTQEAGIDGGGVFKEFIDDLIKDAFSVGLSTRSYSLFTATPVQTLMVNTNLLDEVNVLSHYEFLGRVLGKAVYESILVEPQFCLPFLNQLLGKSNSVEDLKNLDLEYYKNITKLFDMTAAEVRRMDLSFEMTLRTDSSVRTIELIPGGHNILVSKSNVIQYVHLLSHQRLNVLTARQTRAFLCGFRDLIPASWVRLFSAYELQKVISGDDSVRGIDVASLQRSMQYAAGYHPDQPFIRSFWEIIEEMTPDQQRKFLKFMTSCSRQPLLGFGSLEPAPCIQQLRLPDVLFETKDDKELAKLTPLPSSSTCMNLLKLPNYRGKELMRQKLHAAIESGAGFELT